jgi:anaerobic selenocysteine-containing dehydrogenase
MKVTRRDLLVWSAGAAAGLMVTPVPWKLLDDTSIWSQNWPWIPQPARGPVEVKLSACTLCPNGCGMKVRMAAGWPVGVAGVNSHPVSRGALCPLGFGAHQLNWHPRRLRTVRHGASSSTWNEARAAFAKASSEGPVVVIDGYPGRAASSVLQSFVQKQKGEYRVVLGAETRALAPYAAWSGVPACALGYDLENSKTIVSFGAPMLDGWGTPGRFTRLWAERAAGSADPQLRLIQVDSSLSRTAGRAWQWIPIPAEAESALAAGLARVLLEEHLVSARGPMPQLTLAEAASQSGITADAIRELARTIIARTPAVAIAGDDNPSIAALNVVLGSVGTRGGIVRRSKHSESYISSDAAVPNARAVLIDASVPWEFAPQTDAEAFRFAAWDGGSKRADWLLPAPGFMEEWSDVPTAPTFEFETYAVAPGLVKAPHEVQSAAQFLCSVDSSLVPVEKTIHARCDDLFRGRTGSLHGQEEIPVTKLASVQKLEEQLWQGAVWVGKEAPPAALRCELQEWPVAVPASHPENWSTAWPAPVLPPLATKLYRESSLRDTPEMRTA